MAQKILPGLNQSLPRLACKADDGMILSGRHMHESAYKSHHMLGVMAFK